MQPIRHIAIILACASLLGAAPALAAPPEPKQTARLAPSSGTPIRSQSQLERFLQATSGNRTILDLLPPLARQRFLRSLEFGSEGLTDYDPRDLAAELTSDQIKQVLNIFGIEPNDYLLSLARPVPGNMGEHHSAPSMIAKSYDDLRATELATRNLSDKERGAAIAERYESLFSAQAGPALEMLHDHDLELLYRATAMAALRQPDTAYARRMQKLLEQMQTRGLAQKKFYRRVYEALTAARLFPEAIEFATAHPEVELKQLPKLDESRINTQITRTEWLVSTDKRELTRHPVDLKDWTGIVVISHPLCHFSANAAHEIMADPILSTIFDEHAKWLVGPLGIHDFDVVQRWNTEHPKASMTIAYDRDEWPFDLSSTPTFYFFRNGKLATTVVQGWPKEGSRSQVLDALRQIGLVDGSADGSD